MAENLKNEAKKFGAKEINEEVLGYTIRAETIEPNDDNSYAKKITRTSPEKIRIHYYIRCDEHGNFFDPWGMGTGDQYKVIAYKGRRLYEYLEVKEPAFYNYLRFLETRNKNWLRSAQRL